MKLASRLPEGDHNGLRSMERAMLDDPKRPRPVIVILNASKITQDADNGSREVTARILHVESFHPDDLAEVERLVRRGREYASGQPTLPLEIEDEISRALQGVLDGEEPYDPAAFAPDEEDLDDRAQEEDDDDYDPFEDDLSDDAEPKA